MFVLLCNACTDVHEADTQSIVAACVNDFASLCGDYTASATMHCEDCVKSAGRQRGRQGRAVR